MTTPQKHHAREVVRPDYFLKQPGTRILLQSKDTVLLQEHNGMLGLLDRQHNHVYYLPQPTYSAGLNLMALWPPTAIGIYRDQLTEAAGFWLWHGAVYVGLLEEQETSNRQLLPSTRVIATPGRLIARPSSNAPWTPILGHHNKINPLI